MRGASLEAVTDGPAVRADWIWFGRGSRSASRASVHEHANGSRLPEGGLDPGSQGGPRSGQSGHDRATDLAQRGNACCGSPGRDGARLISPVSFLGPGLRGAPRAPRGGLAGAAGAAETKQVWALDPFAGATASTCGCSACSACVAHAANKLFANAVAAAPGRAHLHCNCAVVSFGRVEHEIYDALFRDAGGRASVDRRHQWVRAVLASDPRARGTSVAEAP